MPQWMRVVGPLALAASSLAMANAPAQAQFLSGLFQPFQRVEPLRQPAPAPPPSVIRRRLAAQGYQVIGPLRLNRDVVLADVTDAADRRMRLVVDPVSGAVLQRFAVAEPRPPRQLASRSGNESPVVIRGDDQAYSPDMAPAPRAGAPAASQPRAASPVTKPPRARAIAQKPKPGAVASVNPAAAPESSTAAPAPAPVAPVQQSRVAATATPDAAPAAKPIPPAVPAPAKHEGAGYANGVPINPLD